MSDEEKYWREPLWKDRGLKVEWRNEDHRSGRVYNQERSVDYADYKMGLFYISPLYVCVEGEAAIRR